MTTAPPEEFDYDAEPLLSQIPASGKADDGPWTWTPMWWQSCRFGPDAFDALMQNLVRNPNLLSSWLFRADILPEGFAIPAVEAAAAEANVVSSTATALPTFHGFERADERTVIRRLIPRNTLRDRPMLQTCVFYESSGGTDHADGDGLPEKDDRGGGGGGPVQRSVVVYLPHVASAADMPFYHPKVQGVGFLHEWRPSSLTEGTTAGGPEQHGTGTVSVHFAFFPATTAVGGDDDGEGAERDDKLSRPVLARVALRLVAIVHKHGEGVHRGYVKRVHHDQLVPQARVQDRYTRLKETYARRLVQTWQEATDPTKHVFEDLAIAAFLMELWADMYGGGRSTSSGQGVPDSFPGFVDVGCGNGLLVHVLNDAGYRGWGFDARQRRSWQQYGNARTTTADGAENDEEKPLRECLLLPSFLLGGADNDAGADAGEAQPTTNAPPTREGRLPTHDGRFPPGTFLIANHADELTVHNFTGARFRAPPPSAAAKAATASVSVTLGAASTYASFVEWVAAVAADCGWHVEYEMLRMPSTRNAGLLGRRRAGAGEGAAAQEPPIFTVEQARRVIAKYGGAHGFVENVAKLAAEGKNGTSHARNH
ncbi:DUF1613 domain containing protein [Niveomyces insectorum RCEF 264]|uniref:tRNA (uracil-O(2)-)-methyltransferase n=1 Tax=Niveomyces insectorum RCEF 264 TaxID=1081102 RepID=A0A167WC57_9HYPO|nr:DUF1613 domain containing protein [Niveomyces insectorum RCEF 264]